MIRVIPQRYLLQTIIAIADQDKMEFSPEHFSGLNALERSCLQSIDILVDGRPYDSIWVETVDGPIEALVVPDPITNEITLYHPEEGPMLISSEEVKRQKIDPDRFAKWVQYALLNMPATRNPEQLVPGYAWDLGTPRLGKKTGISIILARRLNEQRIRERISIELSLRQANAIIILTTSATIPADLKIPRTRVIVPFIDVISRTDEDPGLDLERIGMFADRGSSNTLVERRPVERSEDGGWLRIYDREYWFSGGKRVIVLMLFEAWERGYEWVPVSNLLSDYAPGTRLRDVFKDSRAEYKNKWREYLEIKARKARLIT